MKPASFPQANRNLTAPVGMTREECGDLPTFTDGQRCISLWRLSWRERLTVLFSGRVWLWVWSGQTQPPVALQTSAPLIGRYRTRAHTLGRLMVTTTYQGGHAPIVDDAFTEDIEGRRYKSKAVLLSQWFKRKHDREPALAFVVGWRVAAAALLALSLAACSGSRPAPKPPASPAPTVSPVPSPEAPATPRPPKPEPTKEPAGDGSTPIPPKPPADTLTICHVADRGPGKDREQLTLTLSRGRAEWHLEHHRKSGDHAGPCREREGT